MKKPVRRAIALMLVLAVVVFAGIPFGRRLKANQECCQIPLARNLRVTAREMLGLAEYHSQIGQDKWVLETMFPGETHGYFVDVGSADGTISSNTAALERRGWTGVCIDPFPVHMEGRTCQMFKEVVFSEAGRHMNFRAARGLGGLEDALGKWKETVSKEPVVEFTTVTLDDILTRAHAPSYIHFVSLDIEGAELDALQAFPFDRIRVGAFAIEHNEEEPKRSRIVALLQQHGYKRVHSFRQDDFFAPAEERGKERLMKATH